MSLLLLLAPLLGTLLAFSEVFNILVCVFEVSDLLLNGAKLGFIFFFGFLSANDV